MTDNKQNSETGNTHTADNKNTQTADNNKTTTGGSGASTKQAKEGDSASGNTGNAQGGSSKNDTASQITNALQGDTGSIKETFDKAKDATGKAAGEAFGQVKEKAATVIGEQKTTLASGIHSVADSIRQVGENLGNSDDNQVAALAGKYGETLAGQVEKFSSYIDDKELKELVRDVEQFARRNPILFVGGAFALGVLAARFLKSSSRNQSSKKRSQG